jgi:NTE family protein
MKRILFLALSVFLFSSVDLQAKPEHRPKIGLVLGGGGALGMAHVGVLEVLEELHIPIDYIAGTSMGSIVAGMYASGMSPEEIKLNFLSLNWWNVLSNQAAYSLQDFRKKQDYKHFMGMEFGLRDWKILFPPGMAYGQKLNNLLETFALNSVGITNFNNLNIPYRAIATDLVSGKSITLSSGDLPQVMRASMAVPGAFTPVRMNGMVLVDGGVLNNIPVQIVKDMGADIIIAVDVGATAAEEGAKSDFTSIGSILGRTYSLMQRPDQEKQLKLADLVITPQLPGISASQFQLAKKIIPKGRTAAEMEKDKLSAYSVDPETYAAFLKKQRKRNHPKIKIVKISVSGNKNVSESVIRTRIKTKPGSFNLRKISEDLDRIYGMDDFQTVTYQIKALEDGYDLNYHVAEKFWGPDYLHFGLKLEASSGVALWSILLNYTRTQINPLGGELRFDLKGGGHQLYGSSEWYQPISSAKYMFVSSKISYDQEDIYIYNRSGNTLSEITQELAFGQFDLGINFFEYGEFRLGLLAGHAGVDGNEYYDIEDFSDTVVACTGSLQLDQLDDPFFPTKGYQLGVSGLFTSSHFGSSESYQKLDFKFRSPYSFGIHTITPKLQAGTSLGSDLPYYATFDLGGLDQFAGYAPYQFRDNYYGVASLEYRARIGRLPPTLGKGLYAFLRGDIGNVWSGVDEIKFDTLEHGALIGLGANTIFGTCNLAAGKAESMSFRFYFSIGNHF